MKGIELGKNIEQIQGFKAFIPHSFPRKAWERETASFTEKDCYVMTNPCIFL